MSDTSKLKNVSNVLQAAKRLQKRKESKALVPAVERFRIDISEECPYEGTAFTTKICTTRIL